MIDSAVLQTSSILCVGAITLNVGFRLQKYDNVLEDKTENAENGRLLDKNNAAHADAELATLTFYFPIREPLLYRPIALALIDESSQGSTGSTGQITDAADHQQADKSQDTDAKDEAGH